MRHRGPRRAGKVQLRRWFLLGGPALVVVLGATWLISWWSQDDDFVIKDDPPSAGAEVRKFAIHVDGKRVGDYRMEIKAGKDGKLAMSAQAKVKVSYPLYTYRYSYEGVEEYQAGQLCSLRSRAYDDGKRYRVEVRTAPDGLHINTNGHERIGPRGAWTTSYWRLPPEPPGGIVTLLDSDTGKEVVGQLRRVGQEEIRVAGLAQPCSHYLLNRSGSPVDLWYDAQDRLVRQDYLEDGHRTVLELYKILRGK
jgi:hypothetical protein